jgi:hypothetical protein
LFFAKTWSANSALSCSAQVAKGIGNVVIGDRLADRVDHFDGKLMTDRRRQ